MYSNEHQNSFRLFRIFNRAESEPTANKINFREVVKENFHEYCDSSTVHGLSYIGKKTRFERILWIIICCILLFGCGTQIYEIVEKWRQSPLVFLLDNKESPIEEIPFPAVTICPQRMPNNKQFNYTDFLKRFLAQEGNITYIEEEMMLFDIVTKVCFQRLLKYAKKMDPYLGKIPIYNTSDLLDIMDKYFLPSTIKLFFCQGIIPKTFFWDCNLRFTRIWLKEGLCYSFNLLPRSEIFRDGVEFPLAETPNIVLPKTEPQKSHSAVYAEDIGDQEEPYKVFTRRERLHIRTRAYPDFTDETCDPDYFVFIHSPYEIPWDRQTSGYLIQVEDFAKNILTVTPSVVRTNENLKKSFTAKERGCYFEDERPLRFFKRYSQRNCELECMANASINEELFNCTAYWMPRTPEMPLCRFEIYLFWFNIEAMTKDYLQECNCLTDCNDIDYVVTISSSNTPYYDDTAMTKKDIEALEEDDVLVKAWVAGLLARLYVGMNKSYNFEIPLEDAILQSNISVEFDVWKWKSSEIEVHYETSEFLAMKRVQAYSFADFVSQIGGILGCFLGISIFSIIELVYFCTVRMINGIKQQKTRKIIKINPKY